MKEPMQNKTLRLPASMWEDLSNRSENPSKLIRQLISEGLQKDTIKAAKCCGTCELFKKYNHIDSYPDIALTGYCRAFQKETKIFNVCDRSYRAKNIESVERII